VLFLVLDPHPGFRAGHVTVIEHRPDPHVQGLAAASGSGLLHGPDFAPAVIVKVAVSVHVRQGYLTACRGVLGFPLSASRS
jgi:hypothetical protein